MIHKLVMCGFLHSTLKTCCPDDSLLYKIKIAGHIAHKLKVVLLYKSAVPLTDLN